MKNVIFLIAFMGLVNASYGQQKGFYYSIGILTTPVADKYLIGINGNIGYSFSKQQLSMYNRVGIGSVNLLSVEHNYQVSSKVNLYSIARASALNGWAVGIGINRYMESDNTFALDLGLGAKYYINRNTAIYLAPSISIFKGTNIYRSGIMSPFTISLGISR
jgi:hypothetical protein